jgi:hypothetical protein
MAGGGRRIVGRGRAGGARWTRANDLEQSRAAGSGPSESALRVASIVGDLSRPNLLTGLGRDGLRPRLNLHI